MEFLRIPHTFAHAPWAIRPRCCLDSCRSSSLPGLLLGLSPSCRLLRLVVHLIFLVLYNPKHVPLSALPALLFRRLVLHSLSCFALPFRPCLLLCLRKLVLLSCFARKPPPASRRPAGQHLSLCEEAHDAHLSLKESSVVCISTYLQPPPADRPCVDSVHRPTLNVFKCVRVCVPFGTGASHVMST